jgi:hypothetical protein
MVSRWPVSLSGAHLWIHIEMKSFDMNISSSGSEPVWIKRNEECARWNTTRGASTTY